MSATVVTFYSYKGGVGRSQAVANVAVELANRGQRVILWDMDLESPGLHSYFYPSAMAERQYADEDFHDKPGILDVVADFLQSPEVPSAPLHFLLDCWHPQLTSRPGSIRLLPAGKQSPDYPNKLASIPWWDLYENGRGYELFEYIRQELCENADADWVLIDSRTGMTDVGFICTRQLPNLVVVMFALHGQGIHGANRMAGLIEDWIRSEGLHGRIRGVLLQPSRVEMTIGAEIRGKFFDEAWRTFARLPQSHVRRFAMDQWIPYDPEAAFGECIVVGRANPGEQTFLGKSYANLTDQIREYRLDRLLVETPVEFKPDEWVRKIQAGVDELERVAQSIRPQEVDLVALGDTAARASRMHRTLSIWREELLNDVRKILGETAQPPPQLEKAHNTISEWRSFVTWLTTERFADELNRERKDQARNRLLAFVGPDRRQAVEDSLELEFPNWVKLFADAFKSELRREGLRLWLEWITGKLTNGQLKLSDLERGELSTRVDQEAWLINRTQRFLDEELYAENSDDTRDRILKNLLDLFVEVDALSRPIVAQSYDMLCALRTKGDRKELYDDVGKRFWSVFWSEQRENIPARRISNDYPGRDAADHWADAIQNNWDDVPSILDAMVQCLKSMVEVFPDDNVQWRLWFRTFGKDPGMGGALNRFVRDAQVDRKTRLRLASIFFEGIYRDNPELGWDSWTYIMLENGYIAETIYTWKALSSLLTEKSRAVNTRALLEYVLLCARKNQNDELERAFRDREVLYDLVNDPWGAAFVEAVVLSRHGKTVWPEQLRQLILQHWATLRQSLTQQDKLTSERSSWGEPLSNEEYEIAQKINSLRKQIREVAEKTVYRSWEPSKQWEQRLENHWTSRIRLLDQTPICDLGRVAPSANADEWIRQESKKFKDHRPNIGVPEGKAAMGNLEKIYKEAYQFEKKWLDLADPQISYTSAKLEELFGKQQAAWTRVRARILTGEPPYPGASAAPRTLQEWIGLC